MFTWSGIDNLMHDEDQCLTEFRRRNTFLKSLSENIVIENHFWREHDESVINDFLQHGKKVSRALKLAGVMQKEIADHLRPLSQANSVATVVSLKSISGKLRQKNKTKSDELLDKDVALLKQYAKEIMHYYPDAALCTKDEYLNKVNQTYNRDNVTPGQLKTFDDQYDYSEQLITLKPKVFKEALQVGNTFYKTSVIQKMPFMTYNWFLSVCQFNIDTHIAQILFPLNKTKVVDTSQKTADNQEATTGQKGRNNAQNAIIDAEKFRDYITSNEDVSVADNAFIVTFSSQNYDELIDVYKSYEDLIHKSGLLRSDVEIQPHLFRVSQPGAGRHTHFKREDFSHAIVCMCPFTVFSKGVKNPEMIYLTTSSQVVGVAKTRLITANEIMVGKTRGGKDIMRLIEAFFMYAFGININLLEFGDSGKWMIEGLGGTYTTINPDKVGLNPLALYESMIDGKLPARLIDSLVETLTVIFHEDLSVLNYEEQAAAGRVMDTLYKNPTEGQKAPTLTQYYECFEDMIKSKGFNNQDQLKAAIFLSSKLYNFLDKPSGAAFRGQNTLNINPQICGIDLQEVGKDMLKFYLTVITSKFAQNAFSMSSRTRIDLNELHEAKHVSPELISSLVRIVSRMGSKQGGFLSLTSQGFKELADTLDSEVISSTGLMSFMARADKWDEIADHVGMPLTARTLWSQYSTDFDNMNFRQAMCRFNGQWHDLHLTYPSLCLDINTSSFDDRNLRHVIEGETDDLFERIKLLRERRK